MTVQMLSSKPSVEGSIAEVLVDEIGDGKYDLVCVWTACYLDTYWQTFA
jgi:hypothetical protein